MAHPFRHVFVASFTRHLWLGATLPSSQASVRPMVNGKGASLDHMSVLCDSWSVLVPVRAYVKPQVRPTNRHYAHQTTVLPFDDLRLISL